MCVTGATGFLGGHLVRRLLKFGARVTVLARSPEKLPPDIASRLTIVPGDLSSLAALEQAVCDCDFIFHCAANVATWDQRANYDAANIEGVCNLIAAINRAPHDRLRRLVHVSTVDVYGFPVRPADESMPLPVNDFGYGESKRLGEKTMRAECDRLGIPYTVIRPGNITGPGSPFISRIGKELVSGLMLKINSGQVHAGLIDVDNLLDVLLWSGVSANALNAVFNARDPYAVSWNEFLRDFKAQLAGKGIVLNLGYWPAIMAARLIAGGHSMLRLSGEPLLHPLIVQIFGKTCGHSIERIQNAGAPLGTVDYATSLARSVAWFKAQQSEMS
ncbi:NAD-dependent epimerase/dehydratase [Halothiobacillus neapolitanus c2]|uniref:NAD-dependent epimerase/dehydratase n=1 Tax=Halothiobacillus neapolitanus (strain ATCC 23641 / DSM 15147 / CIP 104769 / NCIMB 8539 / c2) TaxID=555778 RepID=D0L0U3_HALNC|nr:NAD-dependent epimerase/dehydratase [Halothiobacillus neapolitanus c2]TDN66628.1 nucleoside-diphosphate-sugar epimerase [Halothiobacillus neapolitanus]